MFDGYRCILCGKEGDDNFSEKTGMCIRDFRKVHADHEHDIRGKNVYELYQILEHVEYHIGEWSE